MVNEFSLIHSAQRSVLLLPDIFQGCTALLDTGALFPIWTKGEKLLRSIGGRFDFAYVSFTGFGGECSASYTIDDINKKFLLDTYDNQICRLLKVKDKDGKLYILYSDTLVN